MKFTETFFLLRHTEHVIPKHRNKKWQETHYFNGRGRDVEHFLLHYREKMWNIKRKARKCVNCYVLLILAKNCSFCLIYYFSVVTKSKLLLYYAATRMLT